MKQQEARARLGRTVARVESLHARRCGGKQRLIAGIALAADAPLLGTLAAGSAALPSYLRARSREVGIDALAGPLDRGGRGLVALIGLILAAASLPWALSVTLLVIAAGSLLTAARRARLIAQALSVKS